MCSLTTINAREKDSQGPWKVAVAYRTSDNKTYATKLLEFEVTMDILNGRFSIARAVISNFICFGLS